MLFGLQWFEYFLTHDMIHIFPQHHRAKRPKIMKTWDRDVFCIPQRAAEAETIGGNISYPRGKERAKLATCGLIGKIHLNSEMTDEDVATEIRSVFSGPMNKNPNFPFLYLQPTGCGSKSLTIPSVSPSFRRNGHQVTRLCSHSGTIYILC